MKKKKKLKTIRGGALNIGKASNVYSKFVSHGKSFLQVPLDVRHRVQDAFDFSVVNIKNQSGDLNLTGTPLEFTASSFISSSILPSINGDESIPSYIDRLFNNFKAQVEGASPLFSREDIQKVSDQLAEHDVVSQDIKDKLSLMYHYPRDEDPPVDASVQDLFAAHYGVDAGSGVNAGGTNNVVTPILLQTLDQQVFLSSDQRGQFQSFAQACDLMHGHPEGVMDFTDHVYNRIQTLQDGDYFFVARNYQDSLSGHATSIMFQKVGDCIEITHLNGGVGSVAYDEDSLAYPRVNLTFKVPNNLLFSKQGRIIFDQLQLKPVDEQEKVGDTIIADFSQELSDVNDVLLQFKPLLQGDEAKRNFCTMNTVEPQQFGNCSAHWSRIAMANLGLSLGQYDQSLLQNFATKKAAAMFRQYSSASAEEQSNLIASYARDRQAILNEIDCCEHFLRQDMDLEEQGRDRVLADQLLIQLQFDLAVFECFKQVSGLDLSISPRPLGNDYNFAQLKSDDQLKKDLITVAKLFENKTAPLDYTLFEQQFLKLSEKDKQLILTMDTCDLTQLRLTHPTLFLIQKHISTYKERMFEQTSEFLSKEQYSSKLNELKVSYSKENKISISFEDFVTNIALETGQTDQQLLSQVERDIYFLALSDHYKGYSL